MTYFTILHWFAMIVIFLLFILAIVLTIRSHDGKSSLYPPIFTAFFIATVFAAFAIYGLDKYTKIARLENIVQKKVLINESFSISGQIRNIGHFKIGACVLEVKISNESFERAGTEGISFVPKSAFDNLFNWGEESHSVETTKEFVIAENLYKGEMRNFTVFMRYPPSYAKPYTRYELFCH
ncbi:DUF2393 family protein [Sulfurospirillum multivorans]|uniref:DUF2393 domain-containing protein n=2 Tax=Sulfurospirillum multivorans TaxID=66821 RepID=A0AA86AJE8_SULMK|nr:DUF2393 family protein [Sulfurospirillum multivorans]AHJ11519.1 hypothetical protein SMUL_0237 [Sulfurospirillum multivorans DSM 12446]QEH05020.1 hypothetical protein SMN_0231 [Sulfurospirillum multivorans]